MMGRRMERGLRMDLILLPLLLRQVPAEAQQHHALMMALRFPYPP